MSSTSSTVHLWFYLSAIWIGALGSGHHAMAMPQLRQSSAYEAQYTLATLPDLASYCPTLVMGDSDICRDHDQLSSSPSPNPWASGDSREEYLIVQLESKAEQLQAKRDYKAAFTLLGQVLSLQLAHHENFYASLTEPTIQRIIALLFDQYPWLARRPEAKEPFTSVALAFTKLPVDTSDLNTLLAVRAVADWCCHPLQYRDALGRSLFAQLHSRMEQVVGQKHPETIRVLYHWERCGYHEFPWSFGFHRPPNYSEERFRAALLELDKVFGRHDPDTIDCARSLGHIYLRQEKYSEAHATFGQLYREQLTEFGAADDRTLWSLSDIAKTLIAQDGNHDRAGKLIWSAPVEGRPSWEWSKLGGGAAAYYHQSRVLATRKAPKHFIWESKVLYCLPIRHLQFRAIYPSDEEKRLLWHPSSAKDHEDKSTTFKYTFELKDDESIHLTVPYIPYSHFSVSRDFSGFTYRYYATVDAPIIASDSWAGWRLEHRQVENWGLEHRQEEKLKGYEHRGDLPVWYPLGEGTAHTQTTSQVTGFFNDIPGDAVMADDIEFNLVSSDWVDYNSFTLHTTAEALTPKFRSANGSTIACRGYISGTWTTLDAEHMWSGLMVFVVDAVFSESAGSNRLHHFLLNTALLRRASQHDLTSDDKRSLAALLNPTLLYFQPPQSIPSSAGGRRHYPDLHTPLQKEYMNEMNRRQKWDRSFENKLLRSGDNGWSQLDKEEEDHRRMKWDMEHIGPLTADRDHGRLPPPDIPPIDPQSWNPFSRWFLKFWEGRK